MTSPELLDFLRKSAETNHFASFEGSAEERTIDVSAIKEYLLTSSFPMRIEGAIIQGDLHLENAVQEGDAALPAIFLHKCELQGALYLSGAKLKHLSLQNSRFRQLDIVTADILGDLDCSNVAPFVLKGPTEAAPGDLAGMGGGEDHGKGSEDSASTPLEEPAYVLGRGVRIAGDLILRGASLRALSMRKKADIADTENKRWAAQFNGSRIEGSIHLNDCVAYGGIHLGSSCVDGDVWCYRLSCTATESDAIRLQTASIAGVLRFHGCTIRGQICLLGAKIGTLIFSKGTFYPDDNYIVAAGAIEVAGDVSFDEGFETIEGTINFDQAHIGGSLRCQGCTLKGLVPNSPERNVPYGAICFSAQSATVGGNLTLQELMVTGAVGLQGIRVDGQVIISGARIHCNSGDRPPCAVFLNDAHIGGGVTFGPNLELRGSMLLDLTEIGGNLSVSDSRINTLVRARETLAQNQELEKQWYEFVFSANNLKVKGSVTFDGDRNRSKNSEQPAQAVSPKKNNSSCRVLGVLSLTGSEIGHDLIFKGADFENSQRFEPRAVDLTGCRIGGSVRVEDCIFRGGLKLTFSRVTGTLQVEHSTMTPARGVGKPGFALDLESARIDSSVSLSDSTFGGIVILDFARIDGPLHILQSTLAEGSSTTRSGLKRNAALRAQSAEIQGELVIGAHDFTSLYKAMSRKAPTAELVAIVGLVDLSRSQVKSRFRLVGCTLEPGEDSSIALQAEQLTVNGSIEIEDVHFSGSVQARHMTVRTNLRWANVNFGKEANKFELQHIKVEGALNSVNLTHEGKLLIDVSSGSANSLNDHLGEDDQDANYSGWGRLKGDNPDLEINLQGFVYESTCDKYSHYERKWWLLRLLGFELPKKFRRRLDWLSQSDDDAQNLPEHHPQPYRRYSAVLRSHGFDALSRKVAAKDGWRELHSEWKRASLVGKFGLGLTKFLFGCFFGFGYKPINAFLTMVLLLAIGAGFAATAANDGMLALASPPAETTSAMRLDPATPVTTKAQGANTLLLPSGSSPTAGSSIPQVAVTSTSTTGHHDNGQTAASCDFMSPQRSHSWGHAWISDAFYAVNLALPIVQLHEKTECEIESPSSAKNDQRSNELTKWHALEDLYSILAKLCTALALITFSGVLRRSE